MDNQFSQSELGLYSEKPARIEGALVENIFYRDLLSPSFKNISTGWWLTMKDDSIGDLVAIKLLGHQEKLTMTDRLVAARLMTSKKISNAIIASPIEGGFGWISFKDLTEKSVAGNWRGSLKHLPVKKANVVGNKTSTEAQRLLLAINELKDNGFLDRVIAEREFASNYLNRYSWDIDAFVIDGNLISGFEVKQKYPMKDGNFGLNQGVLNLFIMIEAVGIPMWHIVLTKPIWDKDFPATTLLTNRKYSEHVFWIGTKIDTKKLANSSTGWSPDYTSIYKQSRLRYHKIRCNEFYLIKAFNDLDNKTCLLTLLNGKCKRIQRINEITM